MALSKLTVRRLTKLADYMDSLPKEAEKHFNMGALWFEHNGTHALPEVITRATLKDCGTMACAAGWAATIPSFKRAGFTVTRNGDLSMSRKEFFGIEERADQYLFFLCNAKTPKQWAARCRKFLRDNA